jgi:hypothetical protein
MYRIVPKSSEQLDHRRRLILVEQETSRQLTQRKLTLLHRERREP